MVSLLDDAIAAHGGMERWNALRHLRVHARIGGGVWTLKGQAGKLDDVTIDADTLRQP